MPALKKFKKYRSEVFYFLTCITVISTLILAGANINKFLNDQTTAHVQGAAIDGGQLLNEKVYWEQIIKDNPTYRDGYLELALINDQLGNKKESEVNFNKAKSIDPNSSKVLQIQKLLNLP